MLTTLTSLIKQLQGDYKLSLMWYGKHIEGSPYHVSTNVQQLEINQHVNVETNSQVSPASNHNSDSSKSRVMARPSPRLTS